jgi:hypothetical protein
MLAQNSAMLVRRSVKNMQNTEWTIAGNVPKLAENVLMNAGRWQE